VTRRALALVAPAIALAALFACSSSDSGAPALTHGDGGSSGGEGGAPPGTSPPPPGSADSGPPVVTVSVTHGGAPKAGIAVVFHGADGAVLATALTGADGRASSAPGTTPASASALLGAADGTTEVVTWTGVALGDVLQAADLVDSQNTVSTLSIALVGDPDNGSQNYTAVAGPCTAATQDPTTAFDLPLTEACIRPNTSVLVRADDGATVLSYSYKQGVVALTDGGSLGVAIGPWNDPQEAAISIANVAQGATMNPELRELADGLTFPNPTGADDGNGHTVYKYANGFADAFQLGFRGAPEDGAAGSQIAIGARAMPGPTFTFDYASRLPSLTAATTDTATATRPTISWTSTKALSAADGGTVSIRWTSADQKTHAWTVIVPPANATTGSVQVPALPPDKAAWAPADGVTLDPPDVLFVESDGLPGYAELRAGAGLVVPGALANDRLAEAALPINGTFRATSIRPQ
jgi:hypothetical protein